VKQEFGLPSADCSIQKYNLFHVKQEFFLTPGDLLDTKVRIVGPLTFLRPTFCAIVDTPTFCAIVGASTSAFERRRAFADSFPGFSR
jgi:hypothetical protein